MRPKQYKILACIMAFYPGEGFGNVIGSIAGWADFLLIVDNSPACSLAASPLLLPANAQIVYNKNEGAVAGALNIALQLARISGFDYLQVFDQDTASTGEITGPLIADLQNNPDVALVSPRFLNLNTGHPGRVMLNKSKWHVKNTWPRTDAGLVDALFAITSASVIDIRKIPDDLFYDERLIIDGVDVDFCLALRARGLQIRVDTAQCIVHGIGNRRNGGGRWSATNYPAERKYLGAKNRIIVWRRYAGQFPGFVLNDIYVFCLDSVRTVLLETQRFKKLGAILRGVLSGMHEGNLKMRKHNARDFVYKNNRLDGIANTPG